MDRTRRFLCGAYYALALIALIATWRQNLAFAADRGITVLQAFVEFWPALLANRATISITVDIFLFVLAANIWMVFEARRIGVRWVWAYIVFGILIAISVTYPLFLAARERCLAVRGPSAEPRPPAWDLLGLLVLAVGTLAFVVHCTLR